MRTTTVEKLASLQRIPANVRNICILAHVDHGKTTLADALVASNGIISTKMAGKLRYLDSREDEQIRGITMKSSAISLHYQTGGEDYLINLIDSPGHVDFSSEVSTAVRLCDGAIVVVDVVEGVCPQTHAVLRQAWLEDIRPILVLNKIDRLILEMGMEPLEAFIHLQQILEQVNVVTSELFTADVMSKQTTNGEGSANQNWTEDADELEHRNIYFSPDQGNVIFASAYDSWGFLIGQFAELYSKKLGISEVGLCKTLWGDYYLNTKTKRVVRGAQAKGKKPLFVQFVLENIWSVYDAVVVRRDKEKTEKIVKSLNLTVSPRDMRHSDPRVQLQAITSRWLPVSAAVLSVVVGKLPSPMEIQDDKVEKLMCSQARRFDSLPEQTQALKTAFLQCSADDTAPVIIFVSKMFPVDKSALPKIKQRVLTEDEIQQRRVEARARHTAMLADRAARLEEGTTLGRATSNSKDDDDTALAPEEAEKEGDSDDHVFVAFGRVYSGTVRRGQKLYVLGPKHDPARALEQIETDNSLGATSRLEDLTSDQHITSITVTDLYLFMGRELEALDSVPAGNVLGIGGLEDHILKSGTLASTVACPAFTDLYFDASPILRVAIEPKQAGGIRGLVRGLKLLNQADPCVQVLVQETGEHVIITAGEVHLQRCIDDLRDRYAKIELSVSKPIVPFRETIVPPPTMDMVNESIQEQPLTAKSERVQRFENDVQVIAKGLVKIYTPDKKCMVQIRALSLPEAVTNLLDENQFLIKTLNLYVESRTSERGKSKIKKISKLKQSTIDEIMEFKVKLEKAFVESGKRWLGMVNSIWAFGPRRVGPNLLVNNIEGYDRLSIWNCIETSSLGTESICLREYDYSVISGFQLATLTGPLCEEPMRGVCFIVEKWQVAADVDEPEHREKVNLHLQSGMACDSLENHMSVISIGPHAGNSDCELQNSNSADIISKSCDSVNQSEHNLESCDSVNQSEHKEESCDSVNQSEHNDESCDRVNQSEHKEESCEHVNQSVHNDELSDTVTPTSDLPVNFPRKLTSRQRSRNSNSFSEFTLLFESDSDDDSDKDSTSGRRQGQGHMSGQLMSIVKDGCRKAFQTQPVRLMAAMYKCNIQATTEVLGKLYAVIGKRYGRIVGDELLGGSQMFNIEAVLPVAESFGFAEELRKKTSGLASPQLVFSHWEVIDIDPFWVPTTEEEILHYGEKADSDNRARIYMNNVRERKGLKVDKKIVEHGEKQRTLTRNK